MFLKNKIEKLIYLLLIVFSIGNNSILFAANTAHTLPKTIVKTASPNHEKHEIDYFANESISEIKGVLETPVKLAENNVRNEESFKSNKRNLTLKVSLRLIVVTESSFLSYSCARVNTLANSPLYIAHRRLLI